MTKKEKQAQIALGTYLQTKWEKYLNLCTESNTFYAKEVQFVEKASKLSIKADKLCAAGLKFYDEAEKFDVCDMDLYKQGRKLRIEGKKLHVKADKFREKATEARRQANKRYKKGRALFETAVKEVYGKGTTIRWTSFKKCILENGDIFE
jgi:hypothetical protein